MNDFKDILLFLSLSLKIFLGFVLINLFYLLLSVLVILGLFMASPMLLIHPLFLLIMLICIVFFHFILKKGFLYKYQWMLNFRFTDFLAAGSLPNHEISTESDSISKLPVEMIKKKFQAVKSDLTPGGLPLISKPVVLLMAMIQLSVKPTSDKKVGITEPIGKHVWRHLLLNLLAFLMLLIPFFLISLLLTIGIQWQLKYLIFFMGFLFAYFLYTALFAPIISLLIQRQIYVSVTDGP